MKFKVRIIAVFVLSVMCLNAHGQRLHADLAFDGLFDNREFKNDMLPQTIYLQILLSASFKRLASSCSHQLC